MFLVKEETENPALEVDSIQTFEEWKKNQINEEKVCFVCLFCLKNFY